MQFTNHQLDYFHEKLKFLIFKCKTKRKLEDSFLFLYVWPLRAQKIKLGTRPCLILTQYVILMRLKCWHSNQQNKYKQYLRYCQGEEHGLEDNCNNAARKNFLFR